MNFKLPISSLINKLILQEDTDNDKKITIEDKGPKCFEIISTEGIKYQVKGTYYLSSLLQELAIAKSRGKKILCIDRETIEENPVDRISRRIKDFYWSALTRKIDEKGLHFLLNDEKTISEITYLYVPYTDQETYKRFLSFSDKFKKLKVIKLPKKISPNYILSLNKKPGILALASNKNEGEPFLVPGGRFNEMYGWDSYFIALGLLQDNKVDLAKSITENLRYQIMHYGKILNGNRSYYLDRTQPPFYSSLIIEILQKQEQDKEWISKHLKTIILEYFSVWMVKGKRLVSNGLNRYFSDGIGLPFEVESGHFEPILKQFSSACNIPLNEFEKKYLDREISNDELDVYFMHDRSMRESGHDTSSRLVNVSANLNTVDVNSLLYKYEVDISFLIDKYFDNAFIYSNTKTYNSKYWLNRAKNRLKKVDKYLWNDKKNIYYDYNFVDQSQQDFDSATTFYPLFANLCSKDQAEKLIKYTLNKFKLKGGLVSSSKESTLKFLSDKDRQWDYPYGWAPHQILLWKGLLNYNYTDIAQEFCYRWLWLITKNAVEYNGTIPEKFNLETSSHKVFAEYGNVGTEFEYITEEGFGWVNASYQIGLSILNKELKEKLKKLIDPDKIFSI